ncbi:hypothetical protein ACLFKT_18535, partial [Paraburkholderia sp. BR14261]
MTALAAIFPGTVIAAVYRFPCFSAAARPCPHNGKDAAQRRKYTRRSRRRPDSSNRARKGAPNTGDTTMANEQMLAQMRDKP